MERLDGVCFFVLWRPDDLYIISAYVVVFTPQWGDSCLQLLLFRRRFASRILRV
jgi:hypothetical protein